MEEFEIWMPIIGYEGRYEVSHFGRVRGLSVYAKNECAKFWDSGTAMMMSLWSNGKHKTVYIHHLVLIAFNCGKPKGLECCHNDGDYTNNYISNLRWGTSKENSNDRLRHGTTVKGEKNGMSKLTTFQVIRIKELLKTGITHKKIADNFGISRSHVTDINNKKRWAHI